MKPKISIAMTVFEGERFIVQQLNSILDQSLVPDEIIICDDSRNDKTYDAIEKIIKQHSDIIKYFKNETQLGVSNNFEKAISRTNGDIIFLSDQDDVWKQDKIAQLASLINASPNCGGAFCNSELVDENLKSLNISHWDLRGFGTSEILSCPTGGMLEFCLKRVPAAGHNMAFKAELKDLILPFPDLKECHDTWIGLVIAATRKWAFTSDTLTQFRQHNNNLSQAGRSCQLKAAMDSIKNDISTWNTALYDALIQRLSGRVEPEMLELLKDRRDHSAMRAKMNCNIFRRFPLIYGEIKNKRYFRYGRGWKNIIQDLILRSL
ncbi:MAG: glycosyltransferase [Victivallaceae bacterium]|nr:glycosyltransferase [Victivallaceae bacterium]